MTHYIYTVHAKEKLQKPEVKRLKIGKKRIEKIIEDPIVVDASEKPVLIAIGSLTRTLSLCVAYRKVAERIRVITFYPAEKGRYEHKVS